MTEKNEKKKKWRIVIYFYFVLILFILWVSASYTWFSISRTPRVSDLQLTIGTVSGMELAYSWDAADEEWTQHLDLDKVIYDHAPLKPVTWVNSEQRYYAASYSSDGRMTGVDKALSDEKNANRLDSEGYYMLTSFYARTGTNVNVSLSPAMTNFDGTEGQGTYVIGSPVWNGETILHDNGGNGAENTIRVGIKITKLDENGNEKANSVQFYIYEPNYDGHADGSTYVSETQSIDGAATLVDEAYMIRQTASTWTETYPVQNGVIIQSLGEFVSETDLFKLSPDEYARIDLYFWMEGQDIDCNNSIGTDAKIIANIQFLAEDEGQSGLEEFK